MGTRKSTAMIAPAVREFLQARNAEFTESWHPRAGTALAEANRDRTRPAELAKTVLIHLRDGFALVAVPADCRIDWASLARVAGTDEMRLATEEEIDELLPSLEVGAIPPLGPMFNLPSFLDRRLAGCRQIAFNGGSHCNTIHMSNEQFLNLVRPVMGDFAVKIKPRTEMQSVLPFHSRQEAGARLAAQLKQYRDQAVALAMPRGGIPVGAEVARLLYVPLGVVAVQKLSIGEHPHTFFGALAAGGGAAVDWHKVSAPGQPKLRAAVAAARRELERRTELYDPFTRLIVSRRDVLLIDDGIASGASMRAAVRSIRALHPARIVVAAPVAYEPALRSLREEADDCVCLASSPLLAQVSEWYKEFPEISDAEALRQLESFSRQRKLTGV